MNIERNELRRLLAEAYDAGFNAAVENERLRDNVMERTSTQLKEIRQQTISALVCVAFC